MGTVLDIPGCRARIAVIRIWAFLHQCILHVCLYITSRTLGLFATQGCSRSELLSSGFTCTFTLGLVKPCCCVYLACLFVHYFQDARAIWYSRLLKVGIWGSAVTDYGADHPSVLLFGLLEPRIFYRISSGFNCTFTSGRVAA